MCSVRTITAPEAADLIVDGAVVTVSSSSGMGCPDAVLAAIGERFQRAGHPQNITSIHPIAAGDMYGVKGIDHLAQPGLLAKVIAGSYPSGPSSMTPPLIWQMINDNAIPAWNLPSGILFDMHREAAAHRPGVLTQTGMDTYVDPLLQGGAMKKRRNNLWLNVFDLLTTTGCFSPVSCRRWRSFALPLPMNAAT